MAALADRKAEALKAGLLSAPVFCTRTGRYFDKRNVFRAFRAIVARANRQISAATPPGTEGRKPLPVRVRFHDLRHTHASLLLSAGHSFRAVSQRFGHAGPVMTLRVYTRCLPTDDTQLADGLDRIVS